MSAPFLVVTADDFGLTDGVCRAIIAAHRDGIVTATSVLAVGRSFEYGASLLRDAPSLAVGAHLAMVGEDAPLLSAREIPTLVDKRGHLPLSYRTVVARGAARRIDPDDVRREFAAQLERITAAGLPVTHLDTHQHTHLWPAVGRVVAQLARDANIPAVRRPWSGVRGPTGIAVRALSRRLAAMLSRNGLRSTELYGGLDEAGSLDRAALERILRSALERGVRSVEVNTHPGEPDDVELSRFDWGGYQWGAEWAMLRDPGTAALVQELGLRPTTMNALPAMRSTRRSIHEGDDR